MSACTRLSLVSLTWLHAIALRVGEEAGVDESTKLAAGTRPFGLGEGPCKHVKCHRGFCPRKAGVWEGLGVDGRDKVVELDSGQCRERYVDAHNGQVTLCRRNPANAIQSTFVAAKTICDSCDCSVESSWSPDARVSGGFQVSLKSDEGRGQDLQVNDPNQNVLATIRNQIGEPEFAEFKDRRVDEDQTFADIEPEETLRWKLWKPPPPINIKLTNMWKCSMTKYGSTSDRVRGQPTLTLPADCTIDGFKDIIYQRYGSLVTKLHRGGSEFIYDPGHFITTDEQFGAWLSEGAEAKVWARASLPGQTCELEFELIPSAASAIHTYMAAK